MHSIFLTLVVLPRNPSRVKEIVFDFDIMCIQAVDKNVKVTLLITAFSLKIFKRLKY